MGKHFIGLVISTVMFLFSSAAFSAGAPSTTHRWFFSAGLGASSGTLAGSDLGLSSRSMIVYGANTDLGLQFGGFRFGAGAEYNLWKQLKSPSDLDGTNAQGTEFSWGPMLGYNFGKFLLLGRYYTSSTYSLEKADSSGNKVSFSKPKSSFSIECRIPFGSGTPYVGLEYKSMQYSSVDSGGTVTSIPSGSELKTSSFGASIGMGF